MGEKVRCDRIGQNVTALIPLAHTSFLFSPELFSFLLFFMFSNLGRDISRGVMPRDSQFQG